PARHHSSVSNFSIFTSWSLSYAVAARFAVDAFYVPPGQQLTEEGVIMQLEIDPEFTVKSPNTALEQEVLVIGPIQATGVEEVKRSDFNIPPATVIESTDKIRARLNAIIHGEKWLTMPAATPCLFVAEKWGDLLINQSGIQAFLVAGGAETPLLNGGVNSWSTDAYGIICFNLGRPLAANERIKVIASYENRSYEGSSTAKYPILYLNNNPHNIVIQHSAPSSSYEENYSIRDGVNKPLELGALVEISPEDVYGNELDIDPEEVELTLMENLDRVELLLDGVAVPLWQNIPLGRQLDALTEGFYTTWTPTENRTYVFKPRVYLKDGTVVEDRKPLNIHILPSSANPRPNSVALRSAPAAKQRERAIEVYPNPVGETFTLTYELPQADEVSVQLQAMNGSLAQSLFTARRQAAGRHQLTVPSGGVASGMYLLIVRGKHGYEQRKKLIKLP
ncbi:T9SS type A sorting domain-containing protein, partial [Hymenobacter sp. BT664]